MSFALVFFMISVTAIILAEYFLNKSILNIPTVLCFPYFVIIPLNNLVMYKYGFYSIDDSVIYLISTGLLCFSLGSFFIDYNKRLSGTAIPAADDNHDKLNDYKIRSMLFYIIIVEAIISARVLSVVARHGVSYIASSSFEGYIISGILGHVFLTIYPLLPVLFYYWLKNKRDVFYLIVYLIGVGLYFLTFVKYHVIGMIVLTYLFVSLEDRKYIKKGAITLLVTAVGIFIGNYILGFTLYGTASKVNKIYYFKHLWTYISGSLIYDNVIFVQGVRVGVGILYKLGSFVLAPVNVFINALLGIRIAPHESLPFRLVGSNGEKGNIIDAIGYLYPSQGSVFEVAAFYIVLFLFGVLFSLIYHREIKKTQRLSVPVCVFMTFFVFFSFFGTFYVNLPPWEILIYSYVLLPLFSERNIALLKKLAVNR